VTESLKQACDAELSRVVAGQPRLPGVVAMVTDRAGTLYAGAAGERILGSGVPMTTDTVFAIEDGRLRALHEERAAARQPGALWAAPGGLVHVGSHGRRLQIWDIANDRVSATPEVHEAGITALALGELDDRLVALTGGAECSLCLWDVALGEARVVRERAHPMHLTAVALGVVSGATVAVTASAASDLLVWDARSLTSPVATLTGHTDWVRSIALGEIGGRTVIVTGGVTSPSSRR